MPGLGLCADQTSHQTLSTSSCFKYQTEQQKTAMGGAPRSTLKRSSTTFRTRRTSQPLFYFFDVSPVRNLVRGSDVEPELDHITYVAYITMRTIVTCIDLERCDKLEPIHRVELLKVGTPCYLHGERRSLGRYEIGRLRVAKPPHHPRRDAMVPKFEPRPPMGNSASRAALNRGC